MTVKDQVGSFCWWSLMTKDVARANDFYQQLFGWQLSEIDLPGQSPSTIYSTGRGGFANPVPLEQDFPGPSHWMTYIVVENVGSACQLAKQLGGEICVPPFDIPTIGQSAVIQDPVGSAFHIFTPTQDDDNLNMMGGDTGEICWMELMVDDPALILPFYTGLFGWDFSAPMPMNGGEYISFEANGEQVGGILKRPPGVPEMPPVWMSYFFVPSVEDWSERAKSLGGNVVMAKAEIPETGFFALIEDPTGAMAYLFEWAGK